VQIRRQFFDSKQSGLELAGRAIYPAELSDNPLGVIASLENQLRRMEERLERAVKNEIELKDRGQRMTIHLQAAFPHAERLATLRKQQAKLDEELQAGKGETMAVAESGEDENMEPAPGEMA